MKPFDALAALDRVMDRWEQHIRQVAEPLSRVLALTEALRESGLRATIYVSLLTAPDGNQLIVLDPKGRIAHDWAERLRPHNGEAGDEIIANWERQLKITGQNSVICPLATRQSWHGVLALLLPADIEDSAAIAASAFLKNTARCLALRMRLDELTCCNRELIDDVVALERLASAGELAGPLAHEFSNFLNVLLLHVAVLEHQLPTSQRTDLAEIRRQGNLASAVVNSFQQHRRAAPLVARSLDLNLAVRAAIAELERDPTMPLPLWVCFTPGEESLPADTVALGMQLSEEPVHIRGQLADFQRLVRFLAANAIRAAALTNRYVTVRTAREEERVVLHIEDTGPSVSPNVLQHFFEPGCFSREGVDALELAASKSLARRLGGSIRVEERAGGGVTIIADFDGV